ncbi:MAG: zinc ribbon domain-containing protein [Kiritimatiellae bacterium]|nr:zinc ribbon domain-containing protein [Kiritimatiellia bacterium]
MSLFREMDQYRRISDAKAAAEKSGTAAKRAAEELELLQRKLAKLTLICRAMWSLLQQQHTLSEQDLWQRMQELEQRDRDRTSQGTREAPKCPKCGRAISLEHSRCMYCGTEGMPADVFDVL